MRLITLVFILFQSLLSAQTVNTFITSGSFTVPAGVTSIFVEAWGAGGAGGGASGTSSFRAIGGGGGGGSYSSGTISVTPGDVINYIVAPQTAVATTTTVDGGSSSFGSVTAEGGKGGECVSAATAGGHIGGVGGLGGVGMFNGGKGGSRVGYDGTNGAPWTGSAGGGGGGTTAAGGDASDVSTNNTGGTGGASGGGNGANGRASSGGNGATGLVVGGGGSGAWAAASTTQRSGGTGARGQVRITYTPLPIELSVFNAKKSGLIIELSFTTATERNNAYFEIERSNDGLSFEKIGEVKGAGNSLVEQKYTFEDKTPARGINYYRLRQVDFDGNSSLSAVRSVVMGKTSQVTLFPTPATEVMNVRVETAFADDAQWQIMDMNGRIVSEGVYFAEQTEQRIPVNTLTEGIYVLRITAGQEVLTQQFRK